MSAAAGHGDLVIGGDGDQDMRLPVIILPEAEMGVSLVSIDGHFQGIFWAIEGGLTNEPNSLPSLENTRTQIPWKIS